MFSGNSGVSKDLGVFQLELGQSVDERPMSRTNEAKRKNSSGSLARSFARSFEGLKSLHQIEDSIFTPRDF